MRATAQRTAERVKTRIAIAVEAAAKTATTARLRAAMAVGLLMPQMSCRPARVVVEQPVAHQRERVGEREHLGDDGERRRQRGDREQRAGEEARHDRDRRAARRCTPPGVGMRLASVSATPYMATASSAAAATNQAMPVARRVEVGAAQHGGRRSAPTTCSAVTASATTRLPSTISGRGIGAASRSRWAPLSRSTMTPMPANMQFSGISRPIVADGDEASCSRCRRPEAAERLARAPGRSRGRTAPA